MKKQIALALVCGQQLGPPDTRGPCCPPEGEGARLSRNSFLIDFVINSPSLLSMSVRLETDGVAIVSGGKSKRGWSDARVYLDGPAPFLSSLSRKCSPSRALSPAGYGNVPRSLRFPSRSVRLFDRLEQIIVFILLSVQKLNLLSASLSLACAFLLSLPLVSCHTLVFIEVALLRLSKPHSQERHA